jgi:hypothetical protein
MVTFRLSVLLIAGLLASGCSSRSAVDTVTLSPEEDVFLAQSPYALDSSVVVLAKVPPARYQGGAIVLTGGRELVVVSPHAWRGYTGTALTTEEAVQRTQRAEQTGVESAKVAQAMNDLNRELERLRGRLQEGYPAKPVPPAAPEQVPLPEGDPLRTNTSPVSPAPVPAE